MKVEEINDLTEQEAKTILVDLYNSFVSDAEFYSAQSHSDGVGDILHNVFSGRVARVDEKISRIRKKNLHN